MMRKNKLKTGNHGQRKASVKKTKATKEKFPDYWSFPKLDKFFSKRLVLFFYLSLIVTVTVGAYLFDLKISEGGDDSGYIVAAKHFLEGISFPSWHGSFYSIFLSPFLALFGTNVFVFKLLSFICVILHFVAFHFAFRKVIAPSFLVIIYMILAVNSHLLYYASQTYSEALYIMLQMWNVLLVFRIIGNHDKNNIRYQLSNWRLWLLTGFVTFLIVQTRNVGLAVLLSILFVFAVNRKFVLILFGLVSFFIFEIPLRIYKIVVWDINQGGAGQQFQTMFLKNPYNPALGTENFNGMVSRFFENLEIYLSQHLPIILGLKPEGSTEKSLFLAIVILLVLVAAFVLAYKHSSKIFFVTTTTLAGIMATFISLQVLWGQSRLILVFTPFILIIVSWLVMHLSKSKNIHVLRLGLLVFLCLIFLKTLSVSVKKIDDHKKDLKENIKGNLYAGYTPDWEHFLRMSEWASKNISDTAKIASRKPSMSFIYGEGRDFFGIYKFLTFNSQEILSAVKKKHDDIIAVDIQQFSKKKVPNQFRYFLGKHNVGFIYDKSSNYMLIDINTAAKERILDELNSKNIQYEPSLQSFIDKIHDNLEQYSSTSSDSLLNYLYKNQVDYVIRGSLRVNPAKKTDRTINTIARYMYYIELKYPGIFSLVQQVGKKEDEPAYLFQIKYDRYNINDDYFK